MRFRKQSEVNNSENIEQLNDFISKYSGLASSTDTKKNLEVDEAKDGYAFSSYRPIDMLVCASMEHVFGLQS